MTKCVNYQKTFLAGTTTKSIMLTKFATLAGGHGVRGDGVVRAAHRQLGFGGARAAAGAWAKAGVFFAGAGLLQRRAGPVDAV